MIKYSKSENIGLLILNRPEKRNALNPELVNEIKLKLADIKNDPDVKSLIITGEGKSFCAGADLSYLNQLRNNSNIENLDDSENLAELFLQIYEFPKPTIAAVNGAAIAGGCGLASVCDLIVADNNHAKFGYSEVKIGFIPAIVSIFLIKRCGMSIAKQMLLTAEIFSAQRAYEINLVNYLSDDVLEKAFEVARNINNNSTYSVQLTKQIINQISNLNVKKAVDFCTKLNAISRSSEDFENGLNDFLNK